MKPADALIPFSEQVYEFLNHVANRYRDYPLPMPLLYKRYNIGLYSKKRGFIMPALFNDSKPLIIPNVPTRGEKLMIKVMEFEDGEGYRKHPVLFLLGKDGLRISYSLITESPGVHAGTPPEAAGIMNTFKFISVAKVWGETIFSHEDNRGMCRAIFRFGKYPCEAYSGEGTYNRHVELSTHEETITYELMYYDNYKGYVQRKIDSLKSGNFYELWKDKEIHTIDVSERLKLKDVLDKEGDRVRGYRQEYNDVEPAITNAEAMFEYIKNY